jgi:hypothetical protein
LSRKDISYTLKSIQPSTGLFRHRFRGIYRDREADIVYIVSSLSCSLETGWGWSDFTADFGPAERASELSASSTIYFNETGHPIQDRVNSQY